MVRAPSEKWGGVGAGKIVAEEKEEKVFLLRWIRGEGARWFKPTSTRFWHWSGPVTVHPEPHSHVGLRSSSLWVHPV